MHSKGLGELGSTTVPAVCVCGGGGLGGSMIWNLQYLQSLVVFFVCTTKLIKRPGIKTTCIYLKLLELLSIYSTKQLVHACTV